MFWDNFVILCNENEKSPNAVCAELGLSTAIATKWKSGSLPRSTTIKKIADYFGVTTEALLTGQKETPTAESDERKKELIELFSLLDDAGRDALIAVAKNMKKQDK